MIDVEMLCCVLGGWHAQRAPHTSEESLRLKDPPIDASSISVGRRHVHVLANFVSFTSFIYQKRHLPVNFQAKLQIVYISYESLSVTGC
jgi:hypothetical protein